MNPGNLLDQFLGGGTSAGLGQMAGKARDKVSSSGMGGVAGGLAVGGLLGVVLGNKKARKMAGGVAGYGAAAAAGALALKAYQNWQSGKAAQSAPVATEQEMAAPVPEAFQIDRAPAAGKEPFQLSLIRAMIGAAKADGHVDAAEQALIFEHVEKMDLDAEGKAFVFDALGKPVEISEIAATAGTQEQAAELYLVSRLAIDPDHPAERVYLDALAHRLDLPADLVAHLNRQAEAGAAA